MTKPRSPLYKAWDNMIQRCTNKNHPDYNNYGGRFISVCARWREYKRFAFDMGPHPGDELTLERRQNALGYSKANCYWATRRTQRRNQRNTKLTAAKAAIIRKRLTQGETGSGLAREFGVSKQLVSQIAAGKSWP